MAGRSLRRVVTNALAVRAQLLLGREATPLEYAEDWVASGRSIADLARAVSADLGRPVSRGFVSFVCQRLQPDARTRIANARAARRRSPLTEPLIRGERREASVDG